VQRLAKQLWVAMTSLTLVASGCAPRQPFYFFEDGDLSHYVGSIQKLEYPDSDQPPLDEAAGAVEPLTLSNPSFDNVWELSLEEAIRTSLENGKVLRNLGGRFASFGGPRPQTGEPAVSQSDRGTDLPAEVAGRPRQLDFGHPETNRDRCHVGFCKLHHLRQQQLTDS